MKKIPENIGKILRGTSYYGLMLLVMTLVAIIALMKFDSPISLKLYVVQSGSMVPALPTGSLVMDKPGDYQVGDIITFRSSDPARDPRQSVTHRITEVDEREGETAFVTKGDANDAQDVYPVLERDVYGKAIGYVPYVGYLIAFAKTEMGFILLIIVPAVLIIYHEVLNIWREARRKIMARRKGQDPVEEKV